MKQQVEELFEKIQKETEPAAQLDVLIRGIENLLDAERLECQQIALSVDSLRGNEKIIAEAIGERIENNRG